MPVISLKALAIVLLSYSCVVIVSDTTEISFTPLALQLLAAASMNHFISAICWSLDRVDGWNSLSTHFCAVASAPVAAALPRWRVPPRALGSSFLPQADSVNAAAATAVSVYIESERFIAGLLWNFPLLVEQAGWEGWPAAI